MKKLMISFLITIAFSYSLTAQIPIPMYDIFTPIGNPVLTYLLSEDPDSVRLANDIEWKNRFPDAQQIITYNGLCSTSKFNCNGYKYMGMGKIC